MPAMPTKAANKARDVRAAEAIAKPFPVAAVVLSEKFLILKTPYIISHLAA